MSKVTNCKNCIGFIVFLFSPKVNFLLAGITIIPDVIKAQFGILKSVSDSFPDYQFFSASPFQLKRSVYAFLKPRV